MVLGCEKSTLTKFFESSLQRLGWSLLIFILAFITSTLFIRFSDPIIYFNGEQLMTRLIVVPALIAGASFFILNAIAGPAAAKMPTPAGPAEGISENTRPFLAQVVGLEWLNPLQRRDYSTEWQLLWTLGLVQPNKNDDMVKEDPKSFSSLQSIGVLVMANRGKETFQGFYNKYIDEVTIPFRQNYFSNEKYFYTVKAKDKTRWRELAGIRVEIALPAGKLDLVKVVDRFQSRMENMYEIGIESAPSVWTRNTLPDLRITEGGANAGFTSLAAGLDYLKAHPQESVWVMNWDSPSFPKDGQINENMVLLVLAGPDVNTERAPLAWVGYPASTPVAELPGREGPAPSRRPGLEGHAGRRRSQRRQDRHRHQLRHPRRQPRLPRGQRAPRSAGRNADDRTAGI